MGIQARGWKVKGRLAAIVVLGLLWTSGFVIGLVAGPAFDWLFK